MSNDTEPNTRPHSGHHSHLCTPLSFASCANDPGNSIGKDGAVALAPALMAMPGLTSLNLGGNKSAMTHKRNGHYWWHCMGVKMCACVCVCVCVCVKVSVEGKGGG